MLKKFSRKILALSLAAAILCTGAFAAGGGTGAAVYTNSTTLANGFTYENAISYTSAGRRVETFTLENAPGSSVHPIVMACDTIYGGMTATQMITYARSLGYNVVGAVNADFGYWDTRIPCGMVVEDGVYKSSPEGNNAIAFSASGAFTSFMPEVNITLKNETNGSSVSLTHFNKTRADNGGLYLYSEYFSTVSTRTSTDGWAVRLKVLDGKMSVSGSMTLQVEELYQGDKAVPIGKGYMILTAATAAELGAEFAKFAVGDTITLQTSCTDEKLASANWVSGCGNILLSEGQVFHSEWWDSAIIGVNPRTAIGIKADGTLVYYVMDGRTSASRGSTLTELTNDLISMGCVSAVNMDGGGSTAMALMMPGDSTCGIVNSPSDGYLRSVCSYILFVTNEVSTGSAKNLYIKQDGEFVLCGSSFSLDYLATNNVLRTVTAPADVAAYSSLGMVSGGVYTAGSRAGVDTIGLSSASTGVSGSGSIHVIAAADALAVKNAATGKTVSSATLEKGATTQLSVAAKYLMRDVHMDKSQIKYAVTGDIGTITADGLFTASGAAGAQGKIIITAAGVTAEVNITLEFEFADMEAHWASDFVRILYKSGIVNGTTESTFTPDGGMKRCDFVMMLYRAAGAPDMNTAASFSDVPADAYYAEAVAWAEANGIAKGSGAGTFDPSCTLTREQGFTFLYRALDTLGVAYSDGDTAQLSGFEDAHLLSSWAQTPTATLISMGVVQGYGSSIDPTDTLTRAQMAKMFCVALYRT